MSCLFTFEKCTLISHVHCCDFVLLQVVGCDLIVTGSLSKDDCLTRDKLQVPNVVVQNNFGQVLQFGIFITREEHESVKPKAEMCTNDLGKLRMNNLLFNCDCNHCRACVRLCSLNGQDGRPRIFLHFGIVLLDLLFVSIVHNFEVS